MTVFRACETNVPVYRRLIEGASQDILNKECQNFLNIIDTICHNYYDSPYTFAKI